MSKYSFSEIPTAEIGNLYLGVISPSEIKRIAVVEVSEVVAFENGMPKEGGLFDLRLGTCMKEFVCKTCEGNHLDCPGHFGNISLALPCFNPIFLSKTLNVLRSVCAQCSALLVRGTKHFYPLAEIQNPRKRHKAIAKASISISKCGMLEEKRDKNTFEMLQTAKNAYFKNTTGCGTSQPTYKLAGCAIQMEFSLSKAVSGESKVLTPSEALRILRRISDEDCAILGFNPLTARPDWGVITELLVPPPHVRPSIVVDAATLGMDDLSFKLAEILKANLQLKKLENEGALGHIISEYHNLLQYHVATYINNSTSGLPHSKLKSGRPIKSLYERLGGKFGRIRGSLMGKRCDFSARTVVGGDPMLSLDEVGIPEEIATNLTIKEKVTQFNIENLQKVVDNGPFTHPGAKTIIRPDGIKLDLRFVFDPKDRVLGVGYEVERHLVNGDIVVFNRQPSLHRMSFMSHRVKLMKGKTFRMSLAATTPYNADFDGDEMNIHVPQTPIVVTECKELMNVAKLIVSSQANRPVMGLVQDGLLGGARLTSRDVFFSRKYLMSILGASGEIPAKSKIPLPCVLKPRPRWSGKQLFGLIIPQNLVYSKNCINWKEEENYFFPQADSRVFIANKTLYMGVIDKKSMGSTAGSLIHNTFLEQGPNACKNLINMVQRLVVCFLTEFGATVSLKDFVTLSKRDREERTARLSKVFANLDASVFAIQKSVSEGELERRPGQNFQETLEGELNDLLNRASDDAGKVLISLLSKNNNILRMVNAGSKGNAINIRQITACLGQQNIAGKRIPSVYKERTLPHFACGENGPNEKGFVRSSYIQGLEPHEVFFHAMAGREGLIDTACKTSTTGYIQRKLIKWTENIIVRYDCVVQTSDKSIVQFLYGEDGLDGTYVEGQEIELGTLTDEKFELVYAFDNEELEKMSENDKIQHEKEIKRLKEYRKIFIEKMTSKIGGTNKNLCPIKNFYLPINIKNLLKNASEFIKSLEGYLTKKKGSFDKKLCVEEIVQMVDKLITFIEENSPGNNRESTKLFVMLMRSFLAAKRLIQEFNVSYNILRHVCRTISEKFPSLIIHPGTNVGIIAAQSIGEPATQMTLNTFHYAGVSAKNVTLGVPRLEELLGMSKNIKTPIMQIYLKESGNINARKLAAHLEECFLDKIIAKVEVYFDKNPAEKSVIEEDEDYISTIFQVEEDLAKLDWSPWTFRLVLDRAKKESRGLQNREIADRIKAAFDDSICVFCSHENSDVLFFQIRFRAHSKWAPIATAPFSTEKQDEDAQEHITETMLYLENLENILLTKIPLAGNYGITNVLLREENENWVLLTEGSNMQEILRIPAVDFTRTVSNDVWEVYENLGIEATRTALINELRLVISFDGSYVNYRHLSVLVDEMIRTGRPNSVTRYGMDKQSTSPVRKSTFERSSDVISEAASFAEIDHLEGCSEQLIFGQKIEVGTGAFEVLVNAKQLSHVVDFETVTEEQVDLSSIELPQAEKKNLSNLEFYENETFDEKQLVSMFSPEVAVQTQSLSPEAAGARIGLGIGPQSPVFGQPQSPTFGPVSPVFGQAQSPTFISRSPLARNYSPSSPNYTPGSPLYSPTSPNYMPVSPSYMPNSPAYSPVSPGSMASPAYTPLGRLNSPGYSPTSPAYSPTSPAYSPTSPSYSPSSPMVGHGYSPTSPAYTPTSPGVSPGYSPGTNQLSPSYTPNPGTGNALSPSWTPTSPSYTPGSVFSPTSPAYTPGAYSGGARYTPGSASYSPGDAGYSYARAVGGYGRSSPVHEMYSPAPDNANDENEKKDGKTENN